MKPQLRGSNLNQTVKTGAVWVAIDRVVLQVLNLISSVVLARLLAPSDFGVMGLVVLVTGLSTRLVHFGFGSALVRQVTIRPDHVATLFVMTLVVNGGICAVVIALSPFVGTYFDDSLVGDVLSLMALNFVIRSVGSCPWALLQRQLNFRAHTIASILDCSLKLSVAIVLALLGWGVWSLAYGELIGGLGDKLYMARAARWVPSVRATRAAARDLFGYGLGASLKSTFIYLSENVDNFVIGKVLGTAALGFYDKAYKLMNLPVKELSVRLNQVLFPAFAQIQDEESRFRAACRKTLLSLALVSYPAFGTLIVLAPEIIRILYGPRWMASVVPFQLLCVAGPPKILSQVIGALINATGSIAPEVKRRAAVLVLVAIGAAVGVRWGLVGVAAAVVIANLIGFALALLLLPRVTPVRARDVLRPQTVPVAATLLLVAVTKICQVWTSETLALNAFAVVGFSLTVGAAVYLAGIWMARDETIEQLLAEFKGDLNLLWSRLPAASARSFR